MPDFRAVPLGGLSCLEIGAPTPMRPGLAAHQVGAFEVAVNLEGLRDLDAERRRLEREIRRLDSDILATRSKLDNPQFVARAPAHVVSERRSRLTCFEEARDTVRRCLAQLSV